MYPDDQKGVTHWDSSKYYLGYVIIGLNDGAVSTKHQGVIEINGDTFSDAMKNPNGL